MTRARVLGFFALLLIAGCSLPKVTVFEDPLSPREHLDLGMAYEEKGEYDLAVREYKAAAEEIPLAHLFLGNVYFSKKDYASAEREFKRAVEKLPLDPRAYNNLAWLYLVTDKNLDHAEELARRALKLAPDDDSAEYRDTLTRILRAKEKRKGP